MSDSECSTPSTEASTTATEATNIESSTFSEADFNTFRYRARMPCAGSLIGQAIGDSIGQQVEGKIREEAEVFFRDYPDTSALLAESVYTDDTQYALCLLQPVLETGVFNVERAVEVFAALCRAKPSQIEGIKVSPGVFRGTGTNAKTSLQRMKKGQHWSACGEPSSGCGAAMRVGPLAAYYYCYLSQISDGNLLENVLHVVIQSALLTHRDPRGIQAAVVIASAICYLIEVRKENFKETEFLKYILNNVHTAEQLLETTYKEYILLPVLTEKQIKKVSREHKSHWKAKELYNSEEPVGDDSVMTVMGKAIKNLIGTYSTVSIEPGLQGVFEFAKHHTEHTITSASNGFALCAPLAAIVISMNATSLEQGVRQAALLGDDADTVASMVGAILGATFGFQGIREELVQNLCNSEKLVERAKALEELVANNGKSTNKCDLYSLIEMESSPKLKHDAQVRASAATTTETETAEESEDSEDEEEPAEEEADEEKEQ